MFNSKNLTYILTMLESIEKISKEINWKNISALRDKISHNYCGIDEYIVWDIIQNYLPKLKSALIEMIPKIEDYKIYLKEALNSEYYEDLKYLEKLIKD